MYIKFCINKIKLRDLEIYIVKYNDIYIYDKKYYVFYKILFYFFFYSWNSFSIRLKFYKIIYLLMKCIKCDYFSNIFKVSICI